MITMKKYDTPIIETVELYSDEFCTETLIGESFVDEFGIYQETTNDYLEEP